SEVASGTSYEALAANELAGVERRAGNIPTALRHYRLAIDSVESQRSKLGGSDEVRAGFSQTFIDYYWDIVGLLVQQGRRAEAFDFVERSRARGLIEMFAEKSILVDNDISQELKTERNSIEADYDRTRRKLQAAAASNDAAATRQLSADLRGAR